MFTLKQRLITVGIVTGIMLNNIPFYFLIIHFTSLGILKKCGKLFGLALFNAIFSIVAGVGVSIWGIVLYVNMIFNMTNNYEYGYDYDYYPSEAIGPILIQIGVVLLLALIIWAVIIITGLSIKSFIDSDKSSHLTDEEKFQLAKLAGVNLSAIPLYNIIKLAMSYSLLEQVDASVMGLVIAYIVLLIAGNIIPIIPFLNMLTFLVSIAMLIVAIVLGIKLNDLRFQLMEEKSQPDVEFYSY